MWMKDTTGYATAAQVIPTLLVALAFGLRRRLKFSRAGTSEKGIRLLGGALIVFGEAAAFDQLRRSPFLPSGLATSLALGAVAFLLAVIGYVFVFAAGNE